MRFLFSLVHHVWKRRMWWATAGFVLIVGFLGEDSFYRFACLLHENGKMRDEVVRYEQQYAEDARALRLLDSSPEAVEKVARVNLLMKTDNEDIYVVVEE